MISYCRDCGVYAALDAAALCDRCRAAWQPSGRARRPRNPRACERDRSDDQSSEPRYVRSSPAATGSRSTSLKSAIQSGRSCHQP